MDVVGEDVVGEGELAERDEQVLAPFAVVRGGEVQNNRHEGLDILNRHSLGVKVGESGRLVKDQRLVDLAGVGGLVLPSGGGIAGGLALPSDGGIVLTSSGGCALMSDGDITVEGGGGLALSGGGVICHGGEAAGALTSGGGLALTSDGGGGIAVEGGGGLALSGDGLAVLIKRDIT